MKRSRAKAVGLGLALFAGHLRSAEPEQWSAAPAPKVTDPVWVAPRAAVAPALPIPFVPVQPAAPPVRTGELRPSTVAPVPEIPLLPTGDLRPSTVAPIPPIPTLPDPASVEPRAWKPAPLAVRPIPDIESIGAGQEPGPPPRPMALDKPRQVDSAEPPVRRIEPAPRQVMPASVELPCAPPELMVPHGYGVPGMHGTFGSPPISLSRDYPAWRDILDNCGLGDSFLFRPATGGPATDRLFFSAEYLLWYVNRQQIPVLATTNTAGGFGFLGEAGTQSLLGPGAFGDGLRSGVRIRAGMWLGEQGTRGIDGSFFYTGKRSDSAAFDSGTFPTITRPIFAPNINAEFGEVVSRPTFSRGSLAIDAESEFWGADVNLRTAICRRCDFRHEWFIGYRFLSLKERLTMTENITALQTAPDPAGTQVFVQDNFRTRNSFHGGQIGAVIERKWGNVSLEARGSIALGATHQRVDIDGVQVRTRPGQTAERFVGGLLAAGPNLGSFTRDKFAVVPELTLNLGYWVSPNVKAFVGYNVLYWSNVIRPGDQIDRVVDVSFVPNPPMGVTASGVNRPLPTFKQADVWANGVQFGVEFRW